jgi:hypothetical protein
MKESDDKQPISGIIQLDDVYWGGAVVANGVGARQARRRLWQQWP